MKSWLIKNKNMITNILGALPAVAVAGYETYGATMGQSGNGTTIALAMVMAVVSYFTGKQPQS